MFVVAVREDRFRGWRTYSTGGSIAAKRGGVSVCHMTWC